MHPLDGVQAKWDRAKEQFDQLLAETDAFFNGEPKPHFSVGEFDTDAWEWVERFQIREEPPPRFGVILGDVLHNLRSALDHLIWQVTLLDGGKPDSRTQFPIVRESKAEFDRVAQRCIPGLTPEHRAVVDYAQPYHAGKNAHRHPLAVLSALSNMDKHRLVNPTYSFIEGDAAEALKRLAANWESLNAPQVEFFLAKEGQRLVHGTPWFRVRFPRTEDPPRSVDVRADMTLGIAFGKIGVRQDDFPRIAEIVLRLSQHFAVDFPQP